MSRGFHASWWQGTAAERAGFSTALLAVPFFWYETDTRDTYQWDGVAWLSIDVGGSGVANQVAYWTGPSVIAGDAGFTYNAGTNTVTVGAIVVASGGDINPADASGQELGDATHRWDLHTQDVYFGGATGANITHVPDNLAEAWKVRGGDGWQYLVVVTTDAQPMVVINDASLDIDFIVGAAGAITGLQVRGSDGQITLGVLGAGAVQSSAGGVLSSGALPLTDLASYTRGDLIYGGGADWADLAHPGAANRVLQSTAAEVGWSAQAVTFPAPGAVPVGTGAANQVAYWTGVNALAGDAGMTYDPATDLLTVGNIDVLSGGDIDPIDAAVQYLGDPTHRWNLCAEEIFVEASISMADDTWQGLGGAAGRIIFDDTPVPDEIIFSTCNVIVNNHITSGDFFTGDGGTYGIAANELLTVNAAGNFTFSGVTSVVVPDGCWVGADAACSWVFDSTNGDVTTLDNVGIGTAAPSYKLAIYREIAGAANIVYSAMRLTTVHDVDMGDGFGGGFILAIKDAVSAICNIGRIAAVRAGADTSGKLVFSVWTGGVLADRVMIRASDVIVYSTEGGQTDRRLTISTADADMTLFYNYDEGGATFHPMSFGGTNSGATGVTVLGDGKVGIGVAVPLEQLHVLSAGGTRIGIDAGGASDAVLELGQGIASGPTWGLGLDASATDAFVVAYAVGGNPSLTANGLFTILTGGNVGIGIAAPTGKLHIIAPTGNTFLQVDTTAGNDVGIRQLEAGVWKYNWLYDGAASYSALQTTDGDGVGTNALVWQIFDGTDDFIVPTGNVGIGTAAPGAKLHISGAGDEMLRLADTSATGDPYLSFYQTTTRRSFIQHRDLNDDLRIVSEFGELSLWTGAAGVGVERLTILSGGNVGIGIAAPQHLLHVGAGADVSGIGATQIISNAAGDAAISARDSTNDVEAFLGCFSSVGVVGTYTDHPLAIRTRNDVRIYLESTDGAQTEAVRVDAVGNVGLGLAAPQGLFHGYDTISGFMHWEYDGVAGVAQTVIPNGAGDVVYYLSVRAATRASDGGVQSKSGSIAPGNTIDVYDDAGGNVCTLTVAADGSITIVRTAGALTYKVGLWLLWL